MRRDRHPVCLAAFGAVLDAAALLDTSVREAPAGARAGARFLLRTGSRTLQGLARQFGGKEEAAEASTDRERFEADLGRLSKAGYVVEEDRRAALRAFGRRRASYAGALALLGRRLYIDVDQRTGGSVESRPR